MKRLAACTLAVTILAVALWLVFSRGTHRGTAAGSSASQPASTTALTGTSRTQTIGAVASGLGGTGQRQDLTPRTGNQTASPAQPAGPPRKRAWDPEFLASLRTAAQGDPIRFELVAGEWAAGTMQQLEHKNGEVIRVTGQLTSPEAGRFFFQKQSRAGVAGDFVGVVEFPASKRAYRIEPTGPGGTSELVERPLGEVVCLNMPRAEGDATNDVEELPPLKPDDFPTVPIPSYQNGIIVLESLPGSTPVLYLDYQGGYTPTWGGITYARPVVSNAQIRDVWKRVAEDYMPFNLNVTTDLKVFQNAPDAGRQRVVVTPTTTAAPNAGGVSYVGSFGWSGDTPCWAFYSSGKNAAEAIAHELGHTLGLSHDGQDAPGLAHVEYYGGQGSGETGWAPIMGVGYGPNVTEWCKGEYTNANNHQDDIAIISGNNGVAYRADDTGDTLATSRYLEIYPDNSARAEGVIERTADTDAFQFTTGGGTVSLRADPVSVSPNLAIQATLYDANNNLLASNNPQTVLWASISTNLPGGTYTFRVTGAGRNDPFITGFSSYASLGYYSVTGTVASARQPSRFSLGENVTNGTLAGVVAASNPGGDPLTYTITSGNTGNTFSIDNNGSLIVANNAMLDYEALARNTQLPVQFQMFVDIVNTANSALTETNRRVVVVVTNVNEPPTLTGFTASVLEHTQPGTAIGTLLGSDPDFYTLLSYSILGGNSNGMFSLDSQSGVLRVAGDPNTATQSVFHLTVMVSDQTPPTPLTATSMVTVTVLPNLTALRPGSISYAVYTNISGTAVSALTNASVYPYDPALEKQVTLFEGDTDRGDNYGAVMRGYLIPPATGSYTFWIATDDNGELWLSSSTNTASATLIASISGANNYAGPRQWTKFASQQSAGISLVAGQAYYIEARLKEGGGGDNLAVAWQCATAGITQDVIPGQFLAPYFLNYVPHPSGFTYNLHRDAFNNLRLGTVTVTDVNSNDGHTFAIVPNNLFTIDAVTGVIRLTNEVNLQTTTKTNYSLAIRATDNGSPARSGGTTLIVNIVPTNAIAATGPEQEIWSNIGTGNAVSSLTSQTTYPKRPDTLRPLSGFDSGSASLADGYGSRIRAILTPTNTGVYTFFIASDDNSQLNFSATTNPATATAIASVPGSTSYTQWVAFASQKSAPITLTAGQSYYLEALHKEGVGADHVEVGWVMPGVAGTNILAGAFLTPVDLNYPPDLSNTTVQVFVTASNGTVLTNLTAIDSALDLLTYKMISGNLSNTFALDPYTGALTVADNTLFATYLVSSFSLVVQVQDSGYGGLYPLKTAQATVTVQVVDNSTTLVWTGGGTNNTWSNGANWGGTAPAENSRLKFSGANRQTNSNDMLTRVGLVSFNTSGFNISGNPLLLLGGISCIGNNTWAINSTLNKPQGFTNGSGTFTIAGAINNNAKLLTLRVASGSMHLDGPISGAGGLTKIGAGPLTITSVNTYTDVTTISAGTVILAEAGTMASSSSIEVQSGSILQVDGVAGGFTVPPAQTLKGNGTIAGNTTIYGSLLPGASIGSLTFSNALVLAGSTLLEISKSGSTLTNDSLQVLDQVTCGGFLTVTNIGGGLAAGDTFPLISVPTFHGAFAALSLPPLNPGLMWDSSQLAVSGTIQVAPLSGPQILPALLNGTNLVLHAQSSVNLQYVLEVTPSLTPPVWTSLSTNSGTGGILTLTAPVNPLQPQGFFRLRAY